MANAFSKEEKVMFDQRLEEFQDALIMSERVSTFATDSQSMERQRDEVWRPMPYIATSYTGSDATSNIKDIVQRNVPFRITTQKHVPMAMTPLELRDALQAKAFGRAATVELGTQINLALANTACMTGSLFVKRTAAAVGFADIALCDTVMNELGVPRSDRTIGLNSRDYNNMADNLASRQTVSGKVQTAYERAMIGSDVSSFAAFKLDTGLRLAAAVPGAGVTINGANQRYVPVATSTGSGGEVSNVDGRYQTLSITVGAAGALKAGDAFTIVGVNSVHPITKQDTGQLRTFRIESIVTGGGTAGANTVRIYPPIIAADSAPTGGELQYKNCSATPANAAALTFLNTVTAGVNPFWHRDSLFVVPGRLAIDDAGMDVMRGTTDNGFELVLQKQTNVLTQRTVFRWDTLFGVTNANPEMNGAIMFSQT